MFNNQKYSIVSSNKKKIEEFKEFGLVCGATAGEDLDEVQGTPYQIATYKALMAGENKIIEDTALNVEGFEDFGSNIKWMLDDLGEAEGKKAEWLVVLGVNDGEKIHVFEGKIEGVLKTPETMPEDAFGFDPYLIPQGETKSLYELKQEGRKNEFSARKKAVESLLDEEVVQTSVISEIPEWQGEWQDTIKEKLA